MRGPAGLVNLPNSAVHMKKDLLSTKTVINLLTEPFYYSLFSLFSRCSYLQLLSSDLHNSLFLIGRLPAESVFFLLYFCLASFVPICHAVFHHAVTHDPSTCAYVTTLCLKSFCLLGPCVKFPHFSSCPSNWFSPSFSKSTFQWLPVYFYLPASTSMSLQHTVLRFNLDTL